MILRVALFTLMAMGLLGFGAVAWVSAHPTTHAADAAPAAERDVIVLTHEVRAGALLRMEDITSKPAASAEITPDAVADTPETRRDFVGGMVRHALSAGELLHTHDVMRPGEHGFLAAVLKPGRRAVTIAVDNVTGTAGLIWPGDRVDVVLTQAMDDPALPPDRRIAAETVMQNALVIAIDRLIVQGAVPDAPEQAAPRTVTLEVDNDDVARIQVAARIGRLSLAVRSADMPGSPGDIQAPVFAGDVSRALRPHAELNPRPPATIHVFGGTDTTKDYRF